MIDNRDRGLAPESLLRTARARAGITQRQLAERAGTKQSVVARIESGKASPTATTLNRLLAAAGLDLQTRLVPRPVRDSHMLKDVSRILCLTPEERLREIANISRLQMSARRA